MPTQKLKRSDKPPAVSPVRHEPDWTIIDTLTDEQIRTQIAADPDVAPELSDEWFEGAEKLEPIDVKAIRTKLGMSQTEFAGTFMVKVSVLRDWEQRRHAPRGPALALLWIIEREPEMARRALASTSKKRSRRNLIVRSEEERRVFAGRGAATPSNPRVIRSPIARRKPEH